MSLMYKKYYMKYRGMTRNKLEKKKKVYFGRIILEENKIVNAIIA